MKFLKNLLTWWLELASIVEEMLKITCPKWFFLVCFGLSDTGSFFLLFIKQVVLEAMSRMWKSKPAISEKGGGWSSLFPGSH